MFLKGAGIPSIGLALSSLTQILKDKDVSVVEFRDYYMSHYGSVLSQAAKENVEGVFNSLQQEEDVSDEIAEQILLACLKREAGRQIAQYGIEIVEGREEAFADILKLVDDYPKLGTNVAEGLVPISTDMETIINDIRLLHMWHINIESLRQPLGGLGPATFVEIAARPETGKTAFGISLALAPNGFCWQGANVLGLYNEEKAEKVMIRAFNAATQMQLGDIVKDLNKAKEIWAKVKDKFTAYDVVGFNLLEIPALIKKHKADIVIIDQLDKIRVDGDFNRGDERLRELYTGTRELAKRENVCIIGVSQLSAEAHNKLYPDFSMLEGSKTGKAAEADLIMCIGSMEGLDNQRGVNICKNKITGIHGHVSIMLDPLLSTYTV